LVCDSHAVIGLQAVAWPPLLQRRCAAAISFGYCYKSCTDDLNTVGTAQDSLSTMLVAPVMHVCATDVPDLSRLW
jgi:hypothetical protein